MAASRHEKTVADYLRSNATFDGSVAVYGGPLRANMLDESPDGVVTCTIDGGDPGHMYGDQGSESAKEVTLQVMLTASPDDYSRGADNANTVWNTLQHAQPSGTGGIWCQQGAPRHQTPDDDSRHNFIIDIRMLVTE